jgi:hypothetical protein
MQVKISLQKLSVMRNNILEINISTSCRPSQIDPYIPLNKEEGTRTLIFEL